jgi:uroporphyrin-III C-methyltransferase
MTGVVYLVGAGPGAPDLLTLRAAKLLERADIVFYDALVHPATVALAANACRIAVGKRCGKHSTAQRFINKRLVDAAASHDTVVRLKGGDPMLFGRAQEEIDALEAAGIRYEVVPGVSAALAGAAQLGTSLTQRGSVRSVTLVTPRVGEGEASGRWEAVAISKALIAAGKAPSTPVAIVENASLPEARTRFGTLETLPLLASQAMSGPGIIFVGPQFRARAAHALTELADRGEPGSQRAVSSR